MTDDSLGAKLASHFPDDLQVTTAEEGDHVQVRLHRQDGDRRLLVAKLDVHPDHVDWKHLARLDLMGPAHKAARELFIDEGLYLICEPQDDKARDALLEHGDWKPIDDGPVLRWDPDGD